MRAVDWIKVTDRLPKMNEAVLVFVPCSVLGLKNGYVEQGVLLSSGWSNPSTTHWMPIEKPME